MDEIISHMMCAVKVRNAKLRNYLKQLKQARHFRQDCRGGTGLKTVFWLVCGNRHNI
jgi:hypothetical protein